MFVESSVLAAASSHSWPHGGGGVISRRFSLHADEQRVRIGTVVADGKAIDAAGLEDRVPVVEQDERVGLPVGHVYQLRAVVAFRPTAVEDVPVCGRFRMERLPRRRVDERLPFVRRWLAARETTRVTVHVSQLFAVSATLEDRQPRLRRVAGLRDDDRREDREQRCSHGERDRRFHCCAFSGKRRISLVSRAVSLDEKANGYSWGTMRARGVSRDHDVISGR